MDYKEKYEQAIFRMNKWVEGSEITDPKEVAEFVFPELKESDDERIKKNCIHFLELQKKHHAATFEIEECIAWLEKQGEFKTANEVEPKFKVGDWITNDMNTSTFQIVKVEGECYVAADGDKINWITQSKPYHLWAIKDAKDGDVLASGQLIILFKEFEEGTDYNFVITYAGIDISGKLQVTDKPWLISNETKPATEEQSDFLFQKMREAGYRWNAEKKELKKIERKYTECKQETKPNGGIIYEDFNDGDGYYKVDLAYLSKSQVELIENLVASWQNHTNNIGKWSEEDERMINSIIKNLDEGEWLDIYQVDWLKSLKERMKGE